MNNFPIILQDFEWKVAAHGNIENVPKISLDAIVRRDIKSELRAGVAVAVHFVLRKFQLLDSLVTGNCPLPGDVWFAWSVCHFYLIALTTETKNNFTLIINYIYNFMKSKMNSLDRSWRDLCREAWDLNLFLGFKSYYLPRLSSFSSPSEFRAFILTL